MDLSLTLSEDFLSACVWTDELIDEWERVIVEEGWRTADSARAVRSRFGRCRIASDEYRGKVTDDLSPDGDDRVPPTCGTAGELTGHIGKAGAPRFPAQIRRRAN